VLHRRRPDVETVKVHFLARKASISYPDGCGAPGSSIRIETAFLIGAGTTQVRAGTVSPWVCKKRGLKLR
jgi:hypothetical protein